MATLEAFLATGQLGAITLGMSPLSVMEAFGDPGKVSAKTNPLLLQYGRTELTFWKSAGDKQQRLRLISIDFLSSQDAGASTFDFSDFSIKERPSSETFLRFVKDIGCDPLREFPLASGQRWIFESGVVVVSDRSHVESIQLSEKETKSQPALPLVDAREPSEAEIHALLREARTAESVGALNAALLVAWSAAEATLRRVALTQALDKQIGVNPAMLLHRMHSEGLLSARDAATFESIRQRRAATAHGLAKSAVDLTTLQTLHGLIAKLLATTK